VIDHRVHPDHPVRPPLAPLRDRAAAFRASGDLAPTVLGGLAVLAVVGGFWFFATGVTPDIWVPTLVFLALFVISVPVLLALSRDREGRPDHRLRKILLLALVVKMSFVFPRYYVAEYLYAGESDSGMYRDGGEHFYRNAKQGKWSIEGSKLASFPQETRALGYVAGVLFLAFGTTYMGSYMIFNWLAFVGLLLVFQGFRAAYPNAPPYRAAALIFFLPSVLYWPSTLGKDAAMTFGLGLVIYGAARLLTPNRPWRGLAAGLAGGYLVSVIRPHLLAIVLVGLGASLLVRRAPGRSSRGAVAVRILLALLMIPLLFVALGRLDAAFGDGTSELSLQEALQSTESRTAIGGSAFEAQPVRTPLDLPVATFSVIFRPFLWEVSSLPVLVSAIEGTALLGLAVASSAWLWRIGPAAYRHPFAAFCVGYCLAFVFAFSNIANAGILARQRVQMLPVLMLVVAAAWERTREVRAHELPDEPPQPALPGTDLHDLSPARP